jgi:hypothetical protein
MTIQQTKTYANLQAAVTEVTPPAQSQDLRERIAGFANVAREHYSACHKGVTAKNQMSGRRNTSAE